MSIEQHVLPFRGGHITSPSRQAFESVVDDDFESVRGRSPGETDGLVGGVIPRFDFVVDGRRLVACKDVVSVQLAFERSEGNDVLAGSLRTSMAVTTSAY